MLQTKDFPRWIRAAMVTTWVAGAGMTLCAVLELTAGIVVASVILFPLMIVWTAWMARSWRTE